MLQLMNWDALAVGGGPAGAAFALELARNGRRVAILERTRRAQHKVCGEFLSTETQELLSYLGVDVTALGASSADVFRLVAGERHAMIPLPFRATTLSRCRMDEALLRTAEDCGARVVRGAKVTSLASCEDAVVVKTETMLWRTKAAALATGKHSLRGLTRPAGSMVGFKQQLASAAAANALMGLVQLVFFRGGYFGACIVEENKLSVGWVMEAGLVREVGADWPAQRAYLSRQSSFIAKLLEGAEPIFAKPISTAAIPYGFLRRQPIAPSVYPLGDQLAVVPSFTGDGLAIALWSGIAAARAVLEGKDAPTFQRQFIGGLTNQFRIARALGGMLERPRLCALTIAAAKRFPRVAMQMVSATRLRGFEGSAASSALAGKRFAAPLS